jgi:hypothetical protein
MTLSLVNWEGEQLQVNRINALKIRHIRPSGAIKISTRGSHYLKSGDKVNISSRDDDYTVEQVDVLEIIDGNTVILSPPVINKIGTSSGAVTHITFERACVCVSLTFKSFQSK